VWRADTVNAFSSFRSKYNKELGTSAQTCTALRSVDDTTNFKLKAGSYNLIQGYRVYSSIDTMKKAALYQGEGIFNTAVFEGATSKLAATAAALIALQFF